MAAEDCGEVPVRQGAGGLSSRHWTVGGVPLGRTRDRHRGTGTGVIPTPRSAYRFRGAGRRRDPRQVEVVNQDKRGRQRSDRNELSLTVAPWTLCCVALGKPPRRTRTPCPRFGGPRSCGNGARLAGPDRLPPRSVYRRLCPKDGHQSERSLVLSGGCPKDGHPVVGCMGSEKWPHIAEGRGARPAPVDMGATDEGRLRAESGPGDGRTPAAGT